MALHLETIELTDARDLHSAFARVANKDDWRYRIAAVVDAEVLAETIQAISQMTGSQTTVEALPHGRFRLYAPGYYVTGGVGQER